MKQDYKLRVNPNNKQMKSSRSLSNCKKRSLFCPKDVENLENQ